MKAFLFASPVWPTWLCLLIAGCGQPTQDEIKTIQPDQPRRETLGDFDARNKPPDPDKDVEVVQAFPEQPPAPKLAPLPSIQGYYHVAGEAEGIAYEGIVSVERMPSGRFFVRWTLRGQPVYAGVADLVEDTLWCAYQSAGAVGLCRYRVSAKDGKPALAGDRGAKEEWTWLRGMDK
jgi:hypothetical protein